MGGECFCYLFIFLSIVIIFYFLVVRERVREIDLCHAKSPTHFRLAGFFVVVVAESPS